MDTPSKILSAADCLSAPEFAIDSVLVPMWGGRVYVRTMSSEDHDLWEYEQINWDVPAQMMDPSDPEGKRRIPNPARQNETWLKQFHARMVSLCACDESGNRLFQDSDIPALLKKDYVSLKIISDKAAELANKQEQQSVEEVEKKSEGDGGSDSPTDSPSPSE